MTYGEIQIESLKKMFLNNDDLTIDKLEEYKQDKKYKTYLFAMPQACNEAINYICNLEPIIKPYTLTITPGVERYDLSELISGFKAVENIITTKPWNMETSNVLKIDSNAKEVIVYYEEYPILVDSSTPTDSELNVNKECTRYIPLYIAGELYKDDDLTLATVYMNEFVSNVSAIAGRAKGVVNNKITPTYVID